MNESPVSPSPPSVGESDLDRLIDEYLNAPPEEKKELLPKIRTRIVDQVRGDQELAIVEAMKLKKLKEEQRRKLAKEEAAKRKGGKGAHSRHRRSRRGSCHSVDCFMRRVRNSVSRFFRQATKKRRHPAPMPRPQEVLKERKDSMRP